MGKDKVRKSNFELMRILCMFFIVLYHVIGKGNVLTNSHNQTLTVIVEFIQLLIVVHVDLFVLLTGYFQSKSNFKMSKMLKIIAQCLFYTIVIMLVLSLTGVITLSKVEIVKNIFVNFIGEYWFINIYLLLYAISPFLNIIIDNMDQSKYKKLLVCCFVIFSLIPYNSGNKFFFYNSGFSLTNFVFLYFVGAYLRKYPVKESYLFKKMTNNSYILILIFIYFLMAVSNFCLSTTASYLVGVNNVFHEIFSNFITEKLNYENPLVIIQAVSIFLIFEKINIKSKFINKISALSLGVYILHENMYIRTRIYKLFKIDNGNIYSLRFILYMFLISLVIFIIGIIIDYLRKVIFDFISKRKVSVKIKDGVKNYISSLGLSINW